jgi:signal transduction histidine kinase/CheY-like chemotaxis protein
LCGISFYLTLQYNKAQKLRMDVNRLIAVRENSEQIDSCILILYSADNDSRLYSVTGNTRYLAQFSEKIIAVDSILDKLTASKKLPDEASSAKIQQLINRKRIKTEDYLRLRRQSDSLMLLSSAKPKANNNLVALAITSKVKSKNAISADTPAKPKRLLGRIASAFQQQQTAATGTVKDTVYLKNSAAAGYGNYYEKLHQASIRLRAREREMLVVNSGIIQELISVLKRYKNDEKALVSQSKIQLRGTLKSVFAGFSQLSILTFVLLVSLIATLLYNLWKIFRHEKKMVNYSEEAALSAAEKTTFLANMSHEIRTPLNSIAGFAEQLQASDLNQEQAVQVKAVRSSAEILRYVVNQVLDFSKYENGKMYFDETPFLLHQVLTELVLSMSVLAEQKGLHLRSELEYDQQLSLNGDPFRLKQVIMNLLGNAIKFTKAGEVVLRSWTSPGTDGAVKLHIEVKDTGIGVSAADLPFVFKEFTQVGDSYKQKIAGTGLGLAISKSIVELQGGEITVASELGKGSTFAFTLPFKLGTLKSATKQDPFSEAEVKALLNNKHVLLAEDNPINVMLAKTILRKWNITCDIAFNGKEALSLFAKNKYDLILTDIQMPEMGGIELTAHIRKSADPSKAKLPIMALTANAMKEDHDHYLSSGINAIALKPFSEKELIHNIVQVLNNHTLTAIE